MVESFKKLNHFKIWLYNSMHINLFQKIVLHKMKYTHINIHTYITTFYET